MALVLNSNNHLDIKPFAGVPTPLECLPYDRAYYKKVRERVIELYGEQATLLQATRAMNSLGNVCYFKKFPDLYNSTPEDLGFLYSEKFEVLGNPFNDYQHGLSHIRSCCAHSSMGESMLKPDQYYMTGFRYVNLLKKGKSIKLRNCQRSLEELAQIPKILRHSVIVELELKKLGIRKAPDFHKYRSTYRSDMYQKDYPKTNTLSSEFISNPINEFELRMCYQLLRAIYMDHKFRLESNSGISFYSTPVNLTIDESYALAFTNEDEDFWIDKIFDWIYITKHDFNIKEFFKEGPEIGHLIKEKVLNTYNTLSKEYIWQT